MSKLYVATDGDGLQNCDGHRRRWSLPHRRDGGWEAGELAEPDQYGKPVLLQAGDLLDELSERIYVAETVGESGAARLLAGTDWSEQAAARFALDCVEHVLSTVPGSADAELPAGGTLGDIISSARRYLSSGTGADNQVLGLVSRVAAARRLRRESTALSDAAFTAAAQAEGKGVDIVNDPAWGTLAAAHDAVLAAVEAVRHVAFPFLAERDNRRYEALEGRKVVEVEEVDTPWGRYSVGGGARYAPSWAAARDAAERSRQAATDLGGAAEGEAERSWQVAKLLEHLGTH